METGPQWHIDSLVSIVSCSVRVVELTYANRNSVSSDVLSTMQSQLSSFPGYKPIVTGHSLGGAIASVASASLVHFLPNLTVYTFGQFRTGDPTYAAYVDRILPYPNLYRITHLNDGVPQTIHQSSGYAHHSREHWELEPFGPSNTYRCSSGDDQVCNEWPVTLLTAVDPVAGV